MSTATALKNNTWCPGGSSAFETNFSDPGGTAANIARWAMEYVYPLNEWLDQLVGDDAEVARFAADWNQASADLIALSDSSDEALRHVADMDGKSIRALRRALVTIRATSTDASEWTEAVAAALSLASRIVTELHDAVAGALAELAGLIASLFDFTLSLSSLDPLDKWRKVRNLVRHVDAFVSVIETLLDQMFDAFDELIRLLRALGPLIQEALDALRHLMADLADAAGFPVGAAGGGALGAFIGTILGGPLGGAIGGLVGTGTGGALGDTFGGVIADRLADDPTVTEIDASDFDLSTDLGLKSAEAYESAMQSRELESLTDFVTQNGYTDVMGTIDRTVIDVKRVVGADGTEHWVVSLPSTQDWNSLKGFMGEGTWADMLKDYPAANDLDTNVALMLSDHPQLATQYERAVYDAMAQAGIPSGAPVVYTGFSQGGIMSAALASDQNSPYTPIGIVTTGAPVDRFAIPDHIPVMSFVHESEIVARIDDGMRVGAMALSQATGSSLPVALYGGNNEDTTALLEDPTRDASGIVPEVHSVGGYQQSVSEWEAANPDQAAQLIELIGGTVVDHQTYSFTERQ